jgi:2-oxoisovalerate dehydrogenase E1 component
VKHPRSVEDLPLVTVTDLGEPGPGAELVDHLGAVLERLVTSAPAGTGEVTEAVRADLLELFEAQITSRWLDVAGRRLRAAGAGRLAIASAGHEGNAAVAMSTRSNDPALLHHRSGAFYLARTALAGLEDGILDLALGLVASSDTPAGGGRHAGVAHPDVAILPPSPTVAGHLPRSVGLAWTLGRQRHGRPGHGRSGHGRLGDGRLGDRLRWPDDAVAVVSFGDGAANHSTTTGAVNALCWASRQGVPMPLLLVCEDNGLANSMTTPPGWIRALYGAREGLRYLYADSAADPLDLLEKTRSAVEIVRSHRRPVLLHLATVRIGGHSPADTETDYRRSDRITADLVKDPLVATMAALVRTGVVTGAEVGERLLEARDRVASAVAEALRRPRLPSRAEVMAPLAPRRPAAVAMLAAKPPPDDRRAQVLGDRPPEVEGPLTLAQSINRSLLDAALVYPELVVIGRDVARKGGVHGVTRGLYRRLGAPRVTDTLLDEQTVFGLSLGAAVSGLLPVAEIQSLADLHSAIGQLRDEACGLAFRSGGVYRNPLVVRVPGLAYHDGDGVTGADHALGALRDIPGLVIACPAHPSEAPGLLRTCLAAAEADGTVSVFLEPIALYHQRDMLTPGDGAWLAPYPAPALWGSFHAPIGRASVWGSGTDLTIATFGNGLRMSMRVAAELEKDGLHCRVVDLRWLAPLPVDDVVRAAAATGRLLIVDETPSTGGVSEGLVTDVLEAGFDGQMARVTARDSFVPTGASAAGSVLVSERSIGVTARALCAE